MQNLVLAMPLPAPEFFGVFGLLPAAGWVSAAAACAVVGLLWSTLIETEKIHTAALATLCEAQKTTKAAHLGNETIQHDQRPWAVIDVSPTGFSFDDEEMDAATLEITIKNIGRTVLKEGKVVFGQSPPHLTEQSISVEQLTTELAAKAVELGAGTWGEITAIGRPAELVIFPKESVPMKLDLERRHHPSLRNLAIDPNVMLAKYGNSRGLSFYIKIGLTYEYLNLSNCETVECFKITRNLANVYEVEKVLRGRYVK